MICGHRLALSFTTFTSSVAINQSVMFALYSEISPAITPCCSEIPPSVINRTLSHAQASDKKIVHPPLSAPLIRRRQVRFPLASHPLDRHVPENAMYASCGPTGQDAGFHK